MAANLRWLAYHYNEGSGGERWRRLAWEAVARALRRQVSSSQWRKSAWVQRRCGSSSRRTRVSCGRVMPGTFFPPVLLKGEQEGAGQQTAHQVMVPAPPTAYLVLIEADLILMMLELGFDG